MSLPSPHFQTEDHKSMWSPLPPKIRIWRRRIPAFPRTRNRWELFWVFLFKGEGHFNNLCHLGANPKMSPPPTNINSLFWALLNGRGHFKEVVSPRLSLNKSCRKFSLRSNLSKISTVFRPNNARGAPSQIQIYLRRLIARKMGAVSTT